MLDFGQGMGVTGGEVEERKRGGGGRAGSAMLHLSLAVFDVAG